MEPLHSRLHCGGEQKDCEEMKSRLTANPELLELPVTCLGQGCECPPLMCAVRAGHYVCVEFLLQEGANPNARGQKLASQETPLFVALMERRIDLVKLLLQNSASAMWHHTRDPTREIINYLTLASMNGQVHMLRLLFEYGAQPNMVTPDSHILTPAQTAIRHNQVESLRVLLLFGSKIKEENYSLLHSTIQSSRYQTKRWENKKRILELLKNFGANIWEKNKDNQTVFDVINDPKYPRLPARELSYALEDITSEPLSLQALSRIAIRDAIGPENYLKVVPSLPLPPMVLAFLNYSF
ncbi:hypothetical protein B566_EDAN012980 [Ephemera danica]|nr:hypothetical protein B566_EDAN012980 [Ephemera danica]